jgi:phosphopantetheinyl transferase
MQISGPSEPPAGEVHVWHGRVFGEPTSDDIAVLADAERARSARLRRPGDRARFVAVHAAQRRLLARYLSTDPAAIRFGRSRCCQCGSSEHGRPNIEWPPTELSHNLSRSGDHWLLAVGVGSQVGVDIECHRDIELDRMAEACLTESERGYLKDQPDELRRQVFFRCWTRKEAVLKACGVGLAGSAAWRCTRSSPGQSRCATSQARVPTRGWCRTWRPARRTIRRLAWRRIRRPRHGPQQSHGRPDRMARSGSWRVLRCDRVLPQSSWVTGLRRGANAYDQIHFKIIFLGCDIAGRIRPAMSHPRSLVVSAPRSGRWASRPGARQRAAAN